MKAFFNWSGGKDSALALHKSKKDGIHVEALLTSINIHMERVSMHGVRRQLIEQQAAAIDLPITTIELPEMPGMDAYEKAVRYAHLQLKQNGFTHGAFGDIFLQDLRKYREDLLAKDGLTCLFPIWQQDTKQLLRQFIDEGFKAIIVCVNGAVLDKSFCGRLLDESFLHDLPEGLDACGENGEYHSFVFDGPIFSNPVCFEKGAIVFKEYASPKKDDCFTTPRPTTGFYFQDLIPV